MESLYVCLFSNGHVKVGRSIDAPSRIATHQYRVACLGVNLVSHEVIACPADVKDAEAALIDWCIQNAEERFMNEWFSGLKYHDVVNEAIRCASADQTEEAATGWAAYLILIKRAGYTQTRIAELIGCSQPSIANFVRGKSESPSFRVGFGLLQIGRKCGIPDPAHLFPIQEPF
jgi:hypothetical protein